MGTQNLMAVLMCTIIACSHQTPILIRDFYSHSFVPSVLHIAYRIENHMYIYYNVTALTSFPGKILFSIFVRRLEDADETAALPIGTAAAPDVPGVSMGGHPKNMVKYKNLDFCKTIELVKNFTTDNFHMESPLQATFIRSCPLTRGFYYITNGTLEDDLVPLHFTTGQYWVQFEVMQVFNEVIKLVNVRALCAYESRW